MPSTQRPTPLPSLAPSPVNTTAFRRRDDDQVVSFLDDDGLNEFLRYFVLAGEGDPIGVCVVVALCIGFCCFCGACVFCEVRTGAWRATARALCRLRAWLRGRNDGPAVKAVSRGVDGGAKSDEKHDDDAGGGGELVQQTVCLLYTSPSPRDGLLSRMPSSA